MGNWLWNHDLLIAQKLRWGSFCCGTDLQYIVYFKCAICVAFVREMGEYILVWDCTWQYSSYLWLGLYTGNCVRILFRRKWSCFDSDHLGLWKRHSFVVIYIWQPYIGVSFYFSWFAVEQLYLTFQGGMAQSSCGRATPQLTQRTSAFTGWYHLGWELCWAYFVSVVSYQYVYLTSMLIWS